MRIFAEGLIVSTTSAQTTLPNFVVFEGVDGVGKSTLAKRLEQYCRQGFPQVPISSGAFPGVEPGTLGEWVYRLHHAEITGLSPVSIAPPALQLLHVAAHVDGIYSWIAPALRQGLVILDRYWWSTYAYARVNLSPNDAWALVAAEQPFWQPLPPPIVFYVTRPFSLKCHEITPRTHQQLDGYYREVIERQRGADLEVHELANDGSLDQCWRRLMDCLGFP
jgi:thymidylate kinase